MATKLKNYSSTPASNNSAPPDGWPEDMAPSAVNNSAREMMARLREWYADAEWIGLGHTINSASGAAIVLAGDVSAYYPVGRAVRADGVAGRVISAVVATNTTVTVSGITFAGSPTIWEVGIVSSDDSLPLGAGGVTVRTLTSAVTVYKGEFIVGDVAGGTFTLTLPVPAANERFIAHCKGTAGLGLTPASTTSVRGSVASATSSDTISLSDGETLELVGYSSTVWEIV